MDETGQIEEGNLQQDPTGVKPISVKIGDKFYVIPTIGDDGNELDKDQAIDQFKETGKHLGAFKSPKQANDFISNAMPSLEQATNPDTSLGAPLAKAEIPPAPIGTPVQGDIPGAPTGVKSLTPIGSGEQPIESPVQQSAPEAQDSSQEGNSGFIPPPPAQHAKPVSRSADGSMVKFSDGVILNLKDGSQTYGGPNGTTWMAREGQKPVNITPKYREDTDAAGRKFRTNLTTGKMEDITSPDFQTQQKLTPLQQVVQQIQSRGFNTNPAIKNWQGAYTKYNQVASNVSIPKRTIADDTALINAVSGIETPGQALSNEQIQLAQKDMSPQEWAEVLKNRLSGNPRMLSDQRVQSMYVAAKRAAEEAKGAADYAMQPFIERLTEAAQKSKTPVDHAINELVGIDPRKPLQEAQPFSGKWQSSSPTSQPGAVAGATPAAPQYQPNMIYPDGKGRFVKFMGVDENGQNKWMPMP
jgi:hypothetical protein